MTVHDIVAIVPMRFLPSTKHRLAQLLGTKQRQQLVKSMLADVIRAIGQSKMITRFVIVTSDEDFLASYAQPVFELHRSNVNGLNEELTEYIEILSQNGTGKAIVILGDLPLLTGTILDELIWSGLKSDRPVIAKDWKGAGTNALFFTYPLAFNLHFGENSFHEHITELENHGLSPIIYHAMETALDIDDTTAIHQLLALAQVDARIQHTRTYNFIRVDEKRSGKVA